MNDVETGDKILQALFDTSVNNLRLIVKFIKDDPNIPMFVKGFITENLVRKYMVSAAKTLKFVPDSFKRELGYRYNTGNGENMKRVSYVDKIFWEENEEMR
jgi:hypothetical protein